MCPRATYHDIPRPTDVRRCPQRTLLRSHVEYGPRTHAWQHVASPKTPNILDDLPLSGQMLDMALALQPSGPLTPLFTRSSCTDLRYPSALCRSPRGGRRELRARLSGAGGERSRVLPAGRRRVSGRHMRNTCHVTRAMVWWVVLEVCMVPWGSGGCFDLRMFKQLPKEAAISNVWRFLFCSTKVWLD